MARTLELSGETYLDVSDAVRLRVEWAAEIDVHRSTGRDDPGGTDLVSSKWSIVLEDLTSDATVNLDDEAVRAFGFEMRAKEAVDSAIDRQMQDALENA